MNSKNARSVLKFVIGWPIALISLFFIFKAINPNLGLIGSYFTNVNIPTLIIGFLCFLVYFFLRAYSWQLILKAKSYKIPFREVLYFWELSEFKRYVPGSIWSLVSRGLSFTEKKVSKNDIIHSLTIEAELIIISCLTVSLLAMQFLVEPLPIAFKNLIYISFFTVIILVNLLFLFSFRIKKNIKNRFLSFLCCDFPTEKVIPLLFFSTLSFIFFGLGSFFVGFAFFYLNLTKIFVLCGFFTFSLLVGYLSFITPMGLGIREAVITSGLSNLVASSIAGLIAIFTRIFLIFTEIIFFLLTLIFYRLKSTKVQKIYDLANKFKFEILLGLFIIGYNAYFIIASILRYENYFAGRFDLGNMDQAVWNTLHGRFFQLTDPNGVDIVSRLAFHADYILVLLAPLYRIWSDPRLLLIVQTVVLSFGAVFVYLIAKNILKNKAFSLIFAGSFLINPALNYTNLYDFHPVTLGTTFLLAVFYFLYKKTYFWFVFFLILAGITKEQVWLIIALFGIYLFIINFRKNQSLFLKSFAILIFLTGICIFYYLIWWAIPGARGGNHFALAYYSEFGDSPSGIIKNVIFSPIKTVFRIFQPDQALYILQLFLPLGFLSLFAPLFLIFAMPDLGINLLSSNAQLHQIYYQYSATITPFIFISGVFGLNFLLKLYSKINRLFFYTFLMFFSVFGAFFYGPLPGAVNPNLDMFTKRLENKKAIDNFLTKIPRQYSIAATNNLGSHLSHRQKIFTIPVGIDRADIIVFLLNDSYAQPSLAAQIDMAKKMENNKNYIQIFKSGDFIAFEKRNLYSTQNPKIKQPKPFPYSIPALINRSYSLEQITIEKQISSNKSFYSFISSYYSDGLKLFALMNKPNLDKPESGYPVLILNHGYINPKEYSTVNSYKEVADFYTKNGFVVVKPDYRGNADSELDNSALMRFAYPTDILNLISSLNSITDVNQNRVFLWGHSMGGEIALKVLEIASKNNDLKGKIKGAILWAPVTDPVKWFSQPNLAKIPESGLKQFPYTNTFKIMGNPDSNSKIWQSVSPLNHLQNIDIPIFIQHGTNDNIVPYTWSVYLNKSLIKLDKNSNLVLYKNNNHNLSLSREQVLSDSLDFLKSH